MLETCKHCRGTGVCQHTVPVIGRILEKGQQYFWHQSKCCGMGQETETPYGGTQPICSHCNGIGKISVMQIPGIAELAAPGMIRNILQALGVQQENYHPALPVGRKPLQIGE